jgi:RNA polymerase sigma-70 factor (ECF subfamily)
MDTEQVIQWLERLPDVQRQVVTARVWGDLTFEQVAEVVDRSTATVFRLFREAIESMRQQVDRVPENFITKDRSRGESP